MNATNEEKRELNPYEIAEDVSFDDDCNSSVAGDEETIGPECDEKNTQIVEETQVDIPVDEYKKILDEHFQNLRSLIKYTKTKDETIQKLSNELQKYREDYCAKTFKAIATLIISFREDCRKSLSDLGSFELTIEKAKKFLSFLTDDFEELLSNAGCEEEEGYWRFNGRPLDIETQNAVAFPQLFVADGAPEDNNHVLLGSNIKEYLSDAENKIKIILADNEQLDKCLQDYCSLASAIENDIVVLCVYPPIRNLISLYKKAKQKIDMCLNELNEDNMIDSYSEVLSFLVSRFEDVLLSGGVKIDTTLEEIFDTRKNRLIRAILTNEIELDRKIAKQYTECYTMNGTVLYPAKVDVYKYQVQKLS